MKPFGSHISGVKEAVLRTADDKEVKIKGRLFERIALKAIGIPHMGLRIRASKVLPSLPKSGLVLDAGCGPGLYSMAISVGGIQVIGGDIDKGKVEVLKNMVEQLGSESVSPSVSDLTVLPFKDSSFDAVLCSDVLEHIKHDRRAVKEFSRVLKKGGRLIVTVPARGSEMSADSFGHVRPGYSVRGLSELMEREGLKVERTEYYAKAFGRMAWKLNRKCFSSRSLTALTFYPLFLLSKLDRFTGGMGDGIIMVSRK